MRVPGPRRTQGAGRRTPSPRQGSHANAPDRRVVPRPAVAGLVARGQIQRRLGATPRRQANAANGGKNRMGFFDRWRRRKLLAAVHSSDWGVAEAAISRVPSELPPGEAFDVLLPLSRGAGHRLANPLTELWPSPTLQFLANAHISKALAAMKQVNDRRVAPHLAT